MSSSATRVLAIGLDATSPELVEQGIADGSLPNLRHLSERGLGGPVRGVDGFFVGSTWPSTYTGRGPAGHGVHYELQLVPGTYDLHRVQHGAFVRAPTLWRRLGEADRRLAILDVPLAAPDPSIEGVQVVDWGGHDVFFGFQALPPELETHLRERHGMHPHGPSCDIRRDGLDDYRSFVETQIGAVALKTAWTRELLERGGWDLLFQVFTEAHCVGHQCWHLHDPDHPAHDPRLAEVLGGPIRRTYRALDRAVGELVAEAGDARVLVWAGHGMSFWKGAHFMLPAILGRLGVHEAPAASASSPGALPHLARRVANAAWRRLPPGLKAPIRRLRGTSKPGAGDRTASVPRLPGDPAASLCFPIHNGTAASGIRLNLLGREPSGRLRDGAEAEEFCEELTGRLLEIVDERTGGPLVRRVVRTRDVHSGPHVELLPDLLVEWDDSVPTGSAIVGNGEAATVRVSSPRFGTLEGTNRFGRTGGHRRNGWFIAAGPGIRPGKLEEGIEVYDIAPTLADWLGVTMDGVEGRPVPALAHPASRPAR